MIDAVLEVAEVITLASTGMLPLPVATRDPKDDYLLAYALAGKADYLVTGNDDLLVLGVIEGVKIVTPTIFLNILAEH